MSTSNLAEAEAALAAEKAAFAAFAEGADIKETFDAEAAIAFGINPLRKFAAELRETVVAAKALNDHSATRSRELSIAITQLETALLWVEKAAA